LLPGNLIKWFSIYNKAPPADSWAWRVFPDGAMWKRAVAEHGSNAVEALTQRYASDLIIAEPCVADTHVNQFTAPTEQPNNAAVFYDVFFPRHSGYLKSNKEEELLSIQNQFAAIRQNLNSTIYLTTMGMIDSDEVSCNHTDNCKHLVHHNERIRGETFRHIQDYCQLYPSNQVVYVQNRFPPELLPQKKVSEHFAYHSHIWVEEAINNTIPFDDRNHWLVRRTQIASDKRCLNALQQGQCNLCGMEFYTIPAMLMNGTWGMVSQAGPKKPFLFGGQRFANQSHSS
jgi:hypothetical protein